MARYGKGTKKLSAQEFIQRIGLIGSEQKKYFDKDGNVKEGYSLVQSQQNSKPVYTHTGYNSKPQPVYKSDTPAPAAAPAPAAPAPDPPGPLMPTISDDSKKYRAETEALLGKIDKKLTDFNATETAATKAKEIAEQTRVRNFAIQSANQVRSNQPANLQIQPASSTSKTAGTQAFKKRRIASNRKQQLTSGINLGTSSLLNI